MRETYLTDAEIKKMWMHRALKDKAMIICLSQLDACEYQEMRSRVEQLGLIEEGKYTSFKRNKSIYANSEHKPYDGYINRPWGNDEIKEVFRMKNKGYTTREIADIMERTPASIKHLIQKYRDIANA